jgi:hypothetical protein
LIADAVGGGTVTHQSPSTKFIPYPTALEHVEAREGALAQRLLMRALAEGLPARGYVIHLWPPYQEGFEALDPELFTPYPQAPPARIERDGSAELRGWSHPHFECRVLNITVNKAQLLERWPGSVKRAKRPRSLARLLKQAEQAKATITLPDGTKLDFTERQGGANEVDRWFAKYADKTQGH